MGICSTFGENAQIQSLVHCVIYQTLAVCQAGSASGSAAATATKLPRRQSHFLPEMGQHCQLSPDGKACMTSTGGGCQTASHAGPSLGGHAGLPDHLSMDQPASARLGSRAGGVLAFWEKHFINNAFLCLCLMCSLSCLRGLCFQGAVPSLTQTH